MTDQQKHLHREALAARFAGQAVADLLGPDEQIARQISRRRIENVIIDYIYRALEAAELGPAGSQAESEEK